ncbi:hypothetical protein TRVA0_026S00496 [Trichomonascus vanleenenianus]|uniref:Yos9p n=1 Tax=Trichomonascus vanleenenianus TaxID=2268995 RepID=UPI003ECB1C78
MWWIYLTAWIGASLAGSFHINRDLYAKPAYSIVFSDESISEEVAASLPAEDEDFRYQFLSTHDRKRYLCSIPKADNASNELTVASTDLVEVRSKAIELLTAPEGCLYYAAGFWTYEVCFDSHIRQFHLTTNNEAQLSFILARFDSTPFTHSGHVSVQNNGEVNSLVQRVAGGEVCDLTGRDRATEIIYLCRPGIDQDQIAWIKEAKTCFYQMAIHTPKLCKEPSFVPQQDTEANEIRCRQVGIVALPVSDPPELSEALPASAIDPPEAEMPEEKPLQIRFDLDDSAKSAEPTDSADSTTQDTELMSTHSDIQSTGSTRSTSGHSDL